LLSYGATCAALPVLRRKPEAPAPRFRAPAGVALSVAALLLSAWLLSYSTARQARDAVLAIGLGLVLYYWSARRRPLRSAV